MNKDAPVQWTSGEALHWGRETSHDKEIVP
jgi:hypothetical protein